MTNLEREENAAILLNAWNLGESLFQYQFEQLNSIVAKAERRSRDRRNAEIMDAAITRMEHGRL